MANLNLLTTRRAALLLFVVLLTAVLAPSTAAQSETPPEIPASYALVGENDTFQLYVDSTTLAFKLLDKRSGYVWHSGLDEPIEGDRLNTSWQAFAKSGISIEYLDSRAINRRVSIANADHVLDITPIEQGVSALVTFLEFDISVGVIIHLEADGVRVEIPFETIREGDSAFRLGEVYLYPFLGAARGSTIPGYMFVPDGTGSLIYFADTTRAENMFYGRYYGPDLGMISFSPYDDRLMTPSPISMPVFGMVHGEGENAFLSVVEDGAGYGEVQVHPAGIITNFNFLYNAFIYNETYFQATNRSGAGVTTVQPQPNVFDAVVHFRFLTGADANYVGMARSYRDYLLDHGMLTTQTDPNPDIGIHLEFLGGDKEEILLWDRFIPMTTIPQMRDILDDLQIPRADVIYYGWQPYGATSMPPTTMALDGTLGSVSDLRDLASQISAGGGSFSLYHDPQSAYWEEPGYSPRDEVAMSITNVNMEGYNRYYGSFFTFDAMRWRFTDLSRSVAAQPNIGLALDGIGWLLYGDYRDDQVFSREAAIDAYRGMLAESPVPLSFYRPNDYLFSLARAYYDMPVSDNGYVYTHASVPFLPIVLSGHLPYYGSALNFSSNRQDDLLRHIEYGIYPSYFVTYEPTGIMLNTYVSSWLYSSSYAQWGAEIQETYQWMNALLAPVSGQEIVAHEAITDGVYVTTYANGQQIIVNYNNAPFMFGERTVEARNALLVESGS